VFCMIVSINYALPITAIAATSGTCGSNVRWTLDNNGTLTISGTGSMKNYSSYSYVPWYASRKSIKHAVIQNGVKSIGNFAFYDSSNLTSVIMENSVTSIGTWVFSDCYNLTSVTISDSITSIGEHAFSHCRSLTTMEIPSKVTSIGDYAFYSCYNIRTATIPHSVTRIGMGAFCCCNSLTSIEIPNSITSIGDSTFAQCGSLTSIIIPDSVTSIGAWAFHLCYNLTQITISDNITNIGEGAFSHTYINVDKANQSYSSKGGVLFNKNKTTLIRYNGRQTGEYTIPDGVTNIGNFALCECDNLTSVTIPKSVTNIGRNVFYQCQSLTDIYYAGSENEWNNIIIGNNNQALTNVTIHYNDQSYMPQENTSKTITRIPAVVNHSYGAKTYESTDEGKIYDLAVAYNEACNNYLDTIKYQAKIDSGVDVLINNAATRMYNEDHKQCSTECHLALAGFPREYEMAAYKAYALYLLNYASKGVEMGKIKLSKDLISINADVIKYVANNFHGIDFTCEYNNYVVTMKGWEYYGVGNGSITVQMKSKNGNTVGSRTGAFTSTRSEISNAMSSFVENWRDVTSDVLKQGLMSVFSELGEVTGFSDFVKEDIENSLKKFNNAMKIAGYGSKVISNLKNCKKGYDAIKGIIADTSPNQERLLNSLANSKDIYNVLNGFDFNFSNIENAGVKSSMETLENARKKLADALYNYTYGFDIDTSYDNWFQKTWLYRTFFQCPVDFTVYDENGNILGYVDNGEVYDNGDIHIEINGDVKVLYIPPELKVRIVMKGTDEGEMNCVLEELSDGKPVGRLNYYNLPLSEGTEYTQEINADTIGENVDSMPIVSENGDITADAYYLESDQSAYVTINAYSIGHGQVIGADEYPIGDPVTLTALAEDDNYQFVGWYDEDDNFISNENIYRFTALINTKLFAKFEKKRYIDNTINIEVLGKYTNQFSVFAYLNDIYNTSLNDIVLYDLNNIGVDSLYYTGYDDSGTAIIENDALHFEVLGNNQYIVEGIDINSYSKVEIFDSAGEMIAILTTQSIDGERVEQTIEGYSIDNQLLRINSYVQNNIGDTISGIIYAAVYNNDILKAISMQPFELEEYSDTGVDLWIENYNYEEGDYIKVFAWDENISPLCIADTVIISYNNGTE